MQIGPPDEVANLFVLESTRDVLTVGSRCVEKGHGFNWSPYSLGPTFVRPDGVSIPLKVESFCACFGDRDLMADATDWSPATSGKCIAGSNKDHASATNPKDG